MKDEVGGRRDEWTNGWWMNGWMDDEGLEI
jgi:hypothetical protein